MLAKITKVRVYRHESQWCYAASSDKGLVESAELFGLDSEAPAEVALVWTALRFNGAEVTFDGEDRKLPTVRTLSL